MSDTEQLREALIDLERARNRERALRMESEALLAGLGVLAFSEDIDSMFAQLFEVLRQVFQFEAAFILAADGAGGLKTLASTRPLPERMSWPLGAFCERVLSGQPAAVFDVARIPEWQAAPEACRDGVRSALHLPLRGRAASSMLVCTHSTMGFFTPRHARLAQRIGPLASQGLLNIELQHTLLERNRFFTLSLEMMCIAGFDGYLRQMNQAWIDGLGFSEAELRATPLLQQLHPDDVPGIRSGLAKLAEGEEKILLECRHRCRDGSYRWLLCSVTAYDGEKLYYVVAQDIHERKLIETALRDSEERYALAASGANDGLWDWNLRTGEVYLSPRWKSMLGYDDQDVDNRFESCFARIHPDDREHTRAAIDAHLRGVTTHCESEHRMRHKDGSYRWVLCRGIAVRDAAGEAYRMAGSLSDITERKLAEQRLEHDALHDGLTGLPNRLLFLERLQQAIRKAARSAAYRYAVLFLDLDQFKVINDGLGHLIGDQLLKELAVRLSECVRATDTVARLGGDEFTLLLEEVHGADDAFAVSERIRERVSTPFLLDGREVFTSVSIGIAMGTAGYSRAEDLLRDADTAMYRAKSLGRARHALFDASMHDLAVRRVQLETDLRQALDRGEIGAFYQPIISLETGGLCGFEALARWRHPERGLISPADFIPLAEETGLIVPLGRHVLLEACRQLRDWQNSYREAARLFVSVNLSARQLSASDFVRSVEGILLEAGLHASQLHLEITESMLMEKGKRTAGALEQLRLLGIKLSIDDFGTGYSSLAYLHCFRFDTLKIDRSFVAQLGGPEESGAIVRTILALARSLNIAVIAEGVETAQQASILAGMGCQCGQGYLFSPPMDAAAATAFILERLPETGAPGGRGATMAVPGAPVAPDPARPGNGRNRWRARQVDDGTRGATWRRPPRVEA